MQEEPTRVWVNGLSYSDTARLQLEKLWNEDHIDLLGEIREDLEVAVILINPRAIEHDGPQEVLDAVSRTNAVVHSFWSAGKMVEYYGVVMDHDSYVYIGRDRSEAIEVNSRIIEETFDFMDAIPLVKTEEMSYPRRNKEIADFARDMIQHAGGTVMNLNEFVTKLKSEGYK